MSLHSDNRGQVMLTSAFLMAITLTLIAMMLNNIIYYNNISYMGFMDHSGYDDVSIKNMVAEEAIFAYNQTKGNTVGDFNAHMADFVESLNNLTVPKGSHISLTTSIAGPWNPAATYKSTECLLTIHTKNSDKTYLICTNYTSPAAAPSPTPGPTPAECLVYISANKTLLMADGHDRAEVTVNVLDKATLAPLSGVTVDLDSCLGGFYDADGVNTLNPVVTNAAGQAVTYYFSTNTGVEVLNASVGANPTRPAGNLSSNFTISCQLPASLCTHGVLVGTPVNAYTSGSKYYVTISIPIQVNPGTYNFDNFKAGAVFVSSQSDNVQLIAPSDITNITETGTVSGPGGYSKNVNVKLLIKNKNKAFDARIIVLVTADCLVDHAAYAKIETFDVTGMYS